MSASSRWSSIGGSTIGVFLGYYALGELGYAFVIPPHRTAVFWPASGLAFALFVRARRARWLWPAWAIAVALAELAAALAHRVPLAVALDWSVAANLVPVTGGLLAARLPSESFGLARIRDVVWLVALCAASAVPGALVSAAVTGEMFHLSFRSMALAWGSSDALGVFVVAPVLLTWTMRQPRPAGRALEGILLFLALTASAYLAFHRARSTKFDPALPSVLLVFLAWASIRFGPRATTLALLILDIVAVTATALDVGPFATPRLDPAAQLLNLQVLVAAIGLVMLLLAAAIEEQREARRLAEAATRIRDEFVSVAAHEFHTPLTSLQLSVQSLLEPNGIPPEAAPRMLEMIDRQVHKLTVLVGSLLDSTRIREGRVQLQLEDVELCGLVREVAARAGAMAGGSGCALSIHADLPISGRWDRMRVEQILTNLLSNATKFGAGKPIDISVGLDAPDVARLVVQDHGIGIPPERLPDIFKRFEQVVAQRRYGGLGLGLYITRSLVQLHGGTIAVASAVGQGTTFTVKLPLRVPAATNV